VYSRTQTLTLLTAVSSSTIQQLPLAYFLYINMLHRIYIYIYIHVILYNIVLMLFRLSLYFHTGPIKRYGRPSSPSTCTHLIPEDGGPPKHVVFNGVLCLVAHSVCCKLDELQPPVLRNSKPQ
jgi:hypothetical protein